MSTASRSLEDQMKAALGKGGVLVSGIHGPYMEVAEKSDGMVWMSRAPVARADFETLELEESYIKTGIGRASMDRAGFRHSPDRPAEAVREREIGGIDFINVALPLEMKPPSVPGGPMAGYVNKAHVIGFEAGRTVAILSTPEGDFVELIGDRDEDATRVLPEGGALGEIVLTEPWVIPLPTPTRVFFWWGASIRSFQGPVTLPSEV